MMCHRCYFEMERQDLTDSRGRSTGGQQWACNMCAHTEEICEAFDAGFEDELDI